MKVKILALAILCSTFSAKPMYQPILESTLSFLVETAPEIAMVGGSLALALNEPRTGNPMPQPEMEQVGNDSQGKDITIDDVVKDTLIDMFHDSVKEASREMNRRNGCNQF